MTKKIKLPTSLFIPNGQRCVLLLHAYSGSPNDVRMMSRILEKQGYSVYAPLFTGHGTLDPSDILTMSANQWWEDTLEAIDFLKIKGFKEIAVFGLSMGGILTTRLLEMSLPELIGGGFFCSPIFPVNNQVPENFLLYSEKVLRLAGEETEVIKEKLQQYPELIQHQLADIFRISQDTAQHLQRISQPFFMAQAGQDEMIDSQGVFETAKALNKQKYVLHWYPESGHVITVGQDHKQLEQDVLQFLQQLPWSEEKI